MTDRISFIACMLLTASCCATVGAQRASFLLADDRESHGTLSSLDDQQVTIERDGKRVTFATVDVQRITYKSTKPTFDSQSIRLQLVDKSVVFANQLTIDNRIATVAASAGFEFQIATRNIEFIEFVNHTELNNVQEWNSIIEGTERTSDLIVFQREGALDYLEGIIVSANEDVVNFRMEDRVVKASRSRIDGLVFYQLAGREFADPVCHLLTTDGGSLRVKNMTKSEQSLVVETVCGASVRLSLDHICEIDLTVGRYQYLSQIVPSTTQWSPLILNPKTFKYQKLLNAPRFNESFERTQLQLQFPVEREYGVAYQPRTFNYGIAAKGGTKLVFPIGRRFKSLSGIVGFSPAASREGQVEITIHGDKTELLRTVMKNRNSRPLAVELPLENVERLTILINYHDARNVGDVVHLCDMKVTK